MTGFKVDVFMDINRFEAAITDWGEWLMVETDSGSEAAANFVKENLQTLLRSYPHLRSEPTPRLAFVESPGMITGQMADSVRAYSVPGSDFWRVDVVAPWARIQELGGWTGAEHKTYIPPRPYFIPTILELDTTGPNGIEHIYYEHWKNAFFAAVALRPPDINPPKRA